MQICDVNSAHRVSESENISEVPGACDILKCQGHVAFQVPGEQALVIIKPQPQ